MLVRNEVRDPRVGMVTVTAVKTSPELDHARVYVTALGEDAEKEEAVAGLQHAAAFIRSRLGQQLRLRRVPELHFEVDRQLEEANRIEALLRQALPDDDQDREPPSGEDTGSTQA